MFVSQEKLMSRYWGNSTRKTIKVEVQENDVLRKLYKSIEKSKPRENVFLSLRKSKFKNYNAIDTIKNSIINV